MSEEYKIESWNKKIIPAEMIRQKTRHNFTLKQIAEFWGIPISMVRRILLERNVVIERSDKVPFDAL
jgi:Zn-dependent peptidase ImmA (M78 family)